MTQELFDQADDADAEPEHRSRRGRKIAIGVLCGALVLLLGGAAAAALYLNSLRGAYEEAVNVIEEQHTFPEAEDRPEETTIEDDETGEQVEDDQINMLLIGSDSGGGSGEFENVPWLPNSGRADTMMWVHIPHERDAVYVMSIMRDTWVPIPGYGEAKINSALSLGEGSSLAVATVESLVGVPIDHVATVDMVGFQSLVSAMGGVTVDSPTSFTSWNGYQFVRGEQYMDPSQAMSFVRERRSFSDGDYTRVRNQQAFLRGVLNDVLTPSTLTNPGRVHEMVSNFAPHMAVDSQLADAGYVADLAWSMRDVRGRHIEMFTMPNLGVGTAGSESIIVADFDAFTEAGEAMRDGSFEDYAANN
ncbi:LCP family protein [Nesterenkonia ebinurensis]|uniref:LCP family protein n=1 Tax=Nesterenkonia ebinurensis TaxID=2608252 RepID=UPI00123DB8AD|nr:LCP family protein [Nesterenkonia ebinurensis]